MNSPNPPVYFGTLKFDPSEPMASQYGGFDRFVTVDTGEYGEQRVWFKAGSLFDHLLQGDTVMLDYRSNKWKLSKQQAPELKMLLQSRAPQVPPAASPAAPTQSPSPTPSVTPIRASEQREDPTTVMIRIFLDLRRGLPQVPDDVIAKLACTIFIQLSK